jgi:hypothetical protein
MPAVVTNNGCHYKNYQEINRRQNQSQHGYARKMLVQVVRVLCNIPVIEIGNSKIEKNIEQKCKIKDGKIKAIFSGRRDILNSTVDAKNPEWLNQQVQKQ